MLQGGNNTIWANAHLESVNDRVKSGIERQPDYAEAHAEKVVTFYKNTCPGNCSDNGNCTETSKLRPYSCKYVKCVNNMSHISILIEL